MFFSWRINRFLYWIKRKKKDMKNTSVFFKKWQCYPNYVRYQNGRTAIELLEANDYVPVAIATVNIPDAHLEEDEVFIKSWSEKGLQSVLIRCVRTFPGTYSCP